jgi:hypothetical protein
MYFRTTYEYIGHLLCPSVTRSKWYDKSFGFIASRLLPPHTGPWNLLGFDILKMWTCWIQESHKSQAVLPDVNLGIFHDLLNSSESRSALNYTGCETWFLSLKQRDGNCVAEHLNFGTYEFSWAVSQLVGDRRYCITKNFVVHTAHGRPIARTVKSRKLQ